MTNFLADYLLFNSGNEAHEHWHWWCGLSVLASCVSRKVWLDLGYFRYYPQLYIVLLGVPGTTKSTALGIAKEMVRDIGGIPFSAECQSKENLVKQLSECECSFVYDAAKPPLIYTPLNIFVNELSQFIGIDPVKMVDLLVTVWSQNFYDMRTQKHGQQLITGPFVNILACTTPSWVTQYLKSDIITGGFSRRCVFVLEWGDSKRIPWPVITDEMQAAYQRCIARGQKLKEVYGQFNLTPEAKEYYERWYLTREISKDPNLAFFDKTKFEQFLKVAMLLSLSESDELVITLTTLQVAMELLDRVFAKLPQVFSGIGRNELAAVSTKLEGLLRRNGRPLTEKEVLGQLWGDASTAETYQVINHMVSVGRLTRFETTFNRDGTDVKVLWLATPEQYKEVLEKRQKQQ